MSRSLTIEQAADQVLGTEPDAVIACRLLRDVLKRPAGDAERMAVRGRLHRHPHVQRLEREQRDDGSWGGLHCGRSTPEHRIGSTEGGVELALALGLDASHSVLRKASAYLTDLLEGRRPFPESEKNDRFPAGWRMFAAATLASIDRRHPAVDDVFAGFREILVRTFSSGAYDPEAEDRAHQELHGIRSGVGYLGLASKYPVALLGSRVEQLPKEIEAAYARWLWSQENLGYLLGRPPEPPVGRTPLWLELWFRSHELLAAYPGWVSLAGGVTMWLWDQRKDRGFWDFGSLGGLSAGLPLPEDRRKRRVREQHWSLRVLTWLRRYEDARLIQEPGSC
jgi:hypothetical protein